MEILDIFLNKRSRRALRTAILRDFDSNLWTFVRRGERIQLISTFAYAHEVFFSLGSAMTMTSVLVNTVSGAATETGR